MTSSSRRLVEAAHFSSSEQIDEQPDVRLVVVDRETDPQHVAADIGDAIFRFQLLVPALCGWASEGEEARVRRSVERVEWLGVPNGV